MEKTAIAQALRTRLISCTFIFNVGNDFSGKVVDVGSNFGVIFQPWVLALLYIFNFMWLYLGIHSFIV